MSIIYREQDKTLTLYTAHTTYQMQIGGLGHLKHLYYGRRVENACMEGLYPPINHGFSPDYYDFRMERGISPDMLPQEYTGCNSGDFRVSTVEVRAKNGAYAADFLYESHSIYNGKYAVSGMPSAFAREDEAQTLSIVLRDPVNGLKLELLYGVYEQQDIITRAARLTNEGGESLTLNRVMTLCLDMPAGQWDLLHFHGRHEMERQMERVPLTSGIRTISTRRGASSHHHNPFIILAAPETTEKIGECFGVMQVYSGSHRTDVEVDFRGMTRVVTGINDELFAWQLEPGEVFHTPEAILMFTHDGIGELSRRYHDFIRSNIMRSQYTFKPRPVLINNWEATYFDFNSDKIVSIAKQASELGVDMMVLDDGWFGGRVKDDNAGLGDWVVNEEKLGGSLNDLIERVHALNMRFGIWVEPEMVNEDSDLYRAHPDWAFVLPGRKPAMGRNQLVLDLSRPEVVDYLTESLTRLLADHPIDYIKWDMNRNISDVYSYTCAPERQGEVVHRYMLGLYTLLERITTAFPNVLFEGCAGGGGRFDAGMMAYFPQIWCSDDTDAVERLTIQHGTSFGYPISAVGAHVSACPNHQTGRNVPLWTRAIVAMNGTFGYELDPNKLSAEEKEEIREQIICFKRHRDLIANGNYYRLNDPQGSDFCAWQYASKDEREALLFVVQPRVRTNAAPICMRLCGLDEQARYCVKSCRLTGMRKLAWGAESASLEDCVFTGAQLMYAGLALPRLHGDCPGIMLHVVRV
ncbi:MAG: alpha-galactosidase [Oscillospiraceae bacterium]|nr:alpha-galactosidase [Oscillospiraceae bacterium]